MVKNQIFCRKKSFKFLLINFEYGNFYLINTKFSFNINIIKALKMYIQNSMTKVTLNIIQENEFKKKIIRMIKGINCEKLYIKYPLL